MDDAEACFILSSRNEVDRMAAVRTTTITELCVVIKFRWHSVVYKNSQMQLLIN